MARKPARSSVAKSETTQIQMRDHIIEATLRCIQRGGIAKTGMGDIANEAGVVRTTVYNHFPQKQDVMQAAFLKVVGGFFENMMKQVNKFETVEDRLVEAAVYICENLPKDPCLGQILDPSMGTLVNEAAIASTESQLIRDELMIQVVSHDPHYLPHIPELSEMVGRMVLSLLLVQPGKKRTRKELRDFIAKWMLPLLVK